MISLTAAAIQSGNRVAGAYAEARSLGLSPQPANGATSAADDFSRIMAQTDVAASAAMQGQGGTETLVSSIAEAQMAMETAVAIRDRVVEAYQDILRMPV